MNCVQEFTVKDEKLFTDNTKVEKLCLSKQLAGRYQDDTKNEIQHSYIVSQGTDKLEISSADDGLGQSLQQPDTVKSKVTCNGNVSKSDAANIVIRQLTPYYKNHRFGSKVQIHLLL